MKVRRIGLALALWGCANGATSHGRTNRAPTAATAASPKLPVAAANPCAEPAPVSSPQAAPRTEDERALAQARDFYGQARYGEALGLLAPLLGKQLESTKPVTALPGLRLRALVAAARGDVAGAVADLRRSLDVSEEWISEARAALTEAQVVEAFGYLRTDEELAYSLAVDHPQSAEAVELALMFATLRKGRLAGEVSKTFGEFARAESQNPALLGLRQVRSEYAAAVLLGARPSELGRLEKQSEELEKKLLSATAMGQLATGMMDATVAPALVMGQLGSNASMGNVLIDFEHFRRYRFGANHEPVGFGEAQYLAFVLEEWNVHVVSLGPAAVVDAAARKAAQAFATPEAPYEAAARDLYARVFGPLEPYLKNDIGYVDRLVRVSPDGQLGLVPFAALLGPDGPLLERFRLSYLDTPRDLWGTRRGLKAATSVHVLAAPDFSRTLPRGAAEGRDCGSFELSEIPALPAASEEAAALEKLLPLAQVKVGPAATRAQLLALASPGILHVATHGIFMSSSFEEPASRGLLIAPSESAPARADGLRRDPLVRSALVLAGSSTDAAGGFVTALEIGAMNLDGTQLVVLSACDTGRGDIHLGQGIYGLRRAFAIAGARTVVTSLWQVNDEATRDMMIRYYQALLKGDGKADAMRDAARTLRKAHPHPYFWAPFIVNGDIGRLEGAAGAGIPRIEPPKRGITVEPVRPVEPIIIGPH